MKEDIRTKTVLVIRKNGYWLSRVEMATGRIVWDQHLSNAWMTRNKQEAMSVAKKTGGTIYLFNPIVWRVKVL